MRDATRDACVECVRRMRLNREISAQIVTHASFGDAGASYLVGVTHASVSRGLSGVGEALLSTKEVTQSSTGVWGGSSMNDRGMRAIETVYRGYRFRSRLEARWAVFFDALGVRWEYEPEGYEFGGTRYLPDFWLPDGRMFVEVKPERGPRVDEKPLAAVRAGGAMFEMGNPAARQMVVVYGDPMVSESDRIEWVGEPLVIRSGAASVCPSCRALQFRAGEISVTRSWITHCRCGDWRLPTFQAFVADAAMASRQARFEHGEQPSLTGRLTHRDHEALPNIYLAGKIRPNDWRHEIGVQPGDYTNKGGRLFNVGSPIQTRYGNWRYNGPDLSIQHGYVDHGIVDDCLRRVARSNMLFAWIDAADVHGTMAELGFWHGLGGGHVVGFSFVAFASDALLDEVWFAEKLATVAVVVPTAKQAWEAFAEWHEYGRCYLGSMP